MPNIQFEINDIFKEVNPK